MGCACLAMNGVGEPCAGEPHARFDWGPLASRASHGRGGTNTQRETRGTEPTPTYLRDEQTSGLPHQTNNSSAEGGSRQSPPGRSWTQELFRLGVRARPVSRWVPGGRPKTLPGDGSRSLSDRPSARAGRQVTPGRTSGFAHEGEARRAFAQAKWKSTPDSRAMPLARKRPAE